MRILHVVDSLDRGGLEQVVCDLSAEQVRRGHDVRVYCLLAPGSLVAEVQAHGVHVHCGYKRRGPDLGVVLELRKLMCGRQPSVMHSHSMMPNYYACAARLLAGFSITVVNTRHDMGSTIPGDRREKLYRLSVPLTSIAVMVSRGVKEHFVAAGIVPEKKARVVLNGIRTDCAQRNDPIARARARQMLAVEDGEFLAGCVGRLVELKNHTAAVCSVAQLAEAFPKLRLVLIGGGPLQSAIAALSQALGVADRVHLLGERSDVRNLLPGLDAFLMPSLTEGHSIALLEAAAAGLSIIATDVGGNSEIICHGQSGLLVPAANIDQIAAALTRVIKDGALAHRLGAAARQWTLKHVSVNAMTDAYEAVYAEALGIS